MSLPAEGSLSDIQSLALGVLGLLLLATVAGGVLARVVRGDGARRTVANLRERTRAWWWMCAIFGGALIGGPGWSALLFALVSFAALREMVSISPTRRADHRTLFWMFFAVIPLQYVFIWIGWYGMAMVFIPVYAFLFVAIRSTLTGDHRDYLARVARLLFAQTICVYFVSHAPALLTLDIPGYVGGNAELLFFLVLVVQLSDVLQYVWGKLCGRHRIAPHLSPNKTWEGFLGGVLSASAVGAALWWATPFTPLQAGAMALGITLMGFAGGIVMSAIKRDAGIKDYGDTIPGHGGIMDRIDSLCFAAPVFFHLVRFYLA